MGRTISALLSIHTGYLKFTNWFYCIQDDTSITVIVGSLGMVSSHCQNTMLIKGPITFMNEKKSWEVWYDFGS